MHLTVPSTNAANPVVSELRALVREAWSGPAWHGPSLQQSLAGLTPEAALARAPLASHNAWEILLHAAYWKHRVTCRVLGHPRGRFPRRPSDWPSPPAKADPARWLEDLGLIERHHAALEAALDGFDDRSVRERRGRVTAEASFRGIALHDVYHAGQVLMLRRQVDRLR